MLFIVGIFLFVLLVVVHEYGHFLVAKRNGVEVEEFGIGFPPKIAGKTFGKGIFRSYYSLNLLPLGGFVRLKGETDSDKRKGSFGAASLGSKVKIMLAGVAMNFIVAILIFTVLAWIGMPKLVDDQFSVASDASVIESRILVGFVEDDSPASQAGLEFGDEITHFQDQEITEESQLFDLTEANAGQSVNVQYVRDSQVIATSTTLNESNEEQGYFGVVPTELVLERSTWSAPIVGVALTAQFSQQTLQAVGSAIGSLVTGDTETASESVLGPVGVVRLLQDVSLIGLEFVLFLIGIISLTLAIMNAMPIPALDGGRLAVTVLFRAIKKPLTPQVEQAIHGTGMALLLMLIVLITIVDVGRL